MLDILRQSTTSDQVTTEFTRIESNTSSSSTRMSISFLSITALSYCFPINCPLVTRVNKRDERLKVSEKRKADGLECPRDESGCERT